MNKKVSKTLAAVLSAAMAASAFAMSTGATFAADNANSNTISASASKPSIGIVAAQNGLTWPGVNLNNYVGKSTVTFTVNGVNYTGGTVTLTGSQGWTVAADSDATLLDTVSLKSKIDQTRLGASVFVHSIKNQLLANRVLNKKLDQELSQPQPSLDKIRELAGELNGVNEAMVARMEELYRAIRTNSILLVPVPVKEVTEAAVDRFHQKYPDCFVRVDIRSDGMILADKEHLSEALYNLLINAQDAVVAAGREQDGQVSLISHNERLYTVLEVKDNGNGMTKTQRKKIFEPFYSSKNSNFNWGMGLYYVREIVKSHLGSIRVESKEGVGSSFFILLPKYQ